MEYLMSLYLTDLSTPNHSTFHTIQGPVRLVCCENMEYIIWIANLGNWPVKCGILGFRIQNLAQRINPEYKFYG